MAESLNTVDTRLLDGAGVAVLAKGWHPSIRQKPIATYLIDAPH